MLVLILKSVVVVIGLSGVLILVGTLLNLIGLAKDWLVDISLTYILEDEPEDPEVGFIWEDSKLNQ